MNGLRPAALLLLWLGACVWKRWYFGACLCMCWLGINLVEVAVYAGDAFARVLPLATFSSDYDSAHDWYQILTRLDRLDQTDSIAHALRLGGVFALATGVTLAMLLIGYMFYRWVRHSPEATNAG